MVAISYIDDNQAEWGQSVAEEFIRNAYSSYEIQFHGGSGYLLGEKPYPLNLPRLAFLTLPYEAIYFKIFSKPYFPMIGGLNFELIDSAGFSKNVSISYRVYSNGKIEIIE
jgi:hypothetical protein